MVRVCVYTRRSVAWRGSSERGPPRRGPRSHARRPGYCGRRTNMYGQLLIIGRIARTATLNYREERYLRGLMDQHARTDAGSRKSAVVRYQMLFLRAVRRTVVKGARSFFSRRRPSSPPRADPVCIWPRPRGKPWIRSEVENYRGGATAITFFTENRSFCFRGGTVFFFPILFPRVPPSERGPIFTGTNVEPRPFPGFQFLGG